MPAPAVRELMGEGVVWDNHACMPLRPGDVSFLPLIERHRAGGAHVVSLNVGYGERGPAEHLQMLAQFRAWFEARPDLYALPRTAAEIRAAKAAGRLSIVFDIEGMNALGEDPTRVRAYYDLGVRWMLIAYNLANPAGGGCLQEDPGLSEFGRAVIEEIERAGMLLCCSHTGWRTAFEAISAARAPVILSHSNAHALCAHPRNVPDELMIACARTGGVVGVTGVSAFLGPGPASAEGVVRHLEHALKVVGPDHVSLALDYSYDQQGLRAWLQRMALSGGPDLLIPLDVSMVEPEAIPAILQLLLDRGHPPGTVRKVMGGNLMRLAEQVWR